MKNSFPPKLAKRLLGAFLKPSLTEEVLGDLDEKFIRDLDNKSDFRSKLNYWYQVFSYLRPFAFKYFKFNPSLTMIRHNFLVSFRIIRKNKAYSLINIGGLALGMSIAILIGLSINYEMSFNQSFDNYESIVQVYRTNTDNRGNVSINSSLPGQLGVILKEDYPDVFDQVSMTFFRSRPQLLTVGQMSYDKMGYFFQANAPSMLSLDMLHGSPTGLADPNSILLSESLSKTFFGASNPIGKLVKLNLNTELLVRGVYKDLAANTTFADAAFIAPISLVYNSQNPYVWDNYNIRVFAQLQDGVDEVQASLAIKELMKPYRAADDSPMELFVLPMKDWHLRSEFKDGFPIMSSRMRYVWMFVIVGSFVLLLACINFVNLNTARFQTRGKEVGVRKSMGSKQGSLVQLYLSESLLYSLAALLLSMGLVAIALPWFNQLVGDLLTIPWNVPTFWFICLGFTFFTAFISGIYPALYISSFHPVKALAGAIRQGRSSIRLRQGLVVFQFAISIALIIGTLAVYQQTQYGKSRPVGYNQSDLISLQGRSTEYYEKFDLLRSELQQSGLVLGVASANYPLTNTLGNNDGFRLSGSTELIDLTFNTIFVSEEYGTTTQWEVLEGRDFSRGRGNEYQNVIVSESAVQQMGLDAPIGQKIISRDSYRGREEEFEIIGVVKDMIKGSPYAEPKPLMLFASRGAEQFMFIRLTDQMPYQSSIPAIENIFKSILPGHPFNYEFVDDSFSRKFKAEEQLSNLASIFSVLAIIISALGLFGLSTFLLEQRTKEIGIRKVLGASTTSLWRLLSNDYTWLVAISCLISVPIAYFALQTWLDSYAYRIALSWPLFAIASFAGLSIALVTVSYHSLKIAASNPVDSLRTE